MRRVFSSNIEVKNLILKFIEVTILDEKIKSSFLDFFTLSCPDDIYRQKQPKITYFLYAWQFLAIHLSNIKFADINWDFITMSYYINPVEFRNYVSSFNLPYRNIVLEAKSDTFALSKMFGYLAEYYIFLLECKQFNDLNVLEIEQYKHLLKACKYNNHSYSTRQLHTDDITERIVKHITQTKFPKGVSYKYIYQVERCTDSGNVSYLNFNLNTNNTFVFELLSNFVDVLIEKAHRINVGLYIFLYHFYDSLGDAKECICNLRNFNKSTFVIQFRYYQKKEEEYSSYIKHSSELFEILLILFYQFLIHLISNSTLNHKVFEDAFECALFTCQKFHYFYSAGYSFIFDNPYDKIPDGDKWYIVPINGREKSVSLYSTTNLTVDFSVLDSKYKDDLKEYIWKGKGLIKSKISLLTSIYDFLDFKKEYDIKRVNINNIHNIREEFPQDLAREYKVYTRGKNSDIKKANRIIKEIRPFLKYILQKYQISKSFLSILKSRGKQERYDDGGNVITANDFKLINGRFEELKNSHEDGELLFIIFFIFATTKLRIGEIVNLKRNCIAEDEVNDDGSAPILYISKTQKDLLVKECFPVEVIDQVRKAIKLTDSIVMNDAISQYVFIKRSSDAQFSKNIRIAFSRVFNRHVVNPLRYKLERCR